MTFELQFTRSATRQLRRLPRSVAERIIERLETIAEDPFARNPNLRALVGVDDGYRLRVGNWRAVYELQRNERRMVVVRVVHRQEGY